MALLARLILGRPRRAHEVDGRSSTSALEPDGVLTWVRVDHV